MLLIDSTARIHLEAHNNDNLELVVAHQWVVVEKRHWRWPLWRLRLPLRLLFPLPRLGDDVVANDGVAQGVGANDVGVNDAASNDVASNHAASNDAASNDVASNHAASNDVASNHAASNDVDVGDVPAFSGFEKEVLLQLMGL